MERGGAESLGDLGHSEAVEAVLEGDACGALAAGELDQEDVPAGVGIAAEGLGHDAALDVLVGESHEVGLARPPVVEHDAPDGPEPLVDARAQVAPPLVGELAFDDRGVHARVGWEEAVEDRGVAEVGPEGECEGESQGDAEPRATILRRGRRAWPGGVQPR